MASQTKKKKRNRRQKPPHADLAAAMRATERPKHFNCRCEAPLVVVDTLAMSPQASRLIDELWTTGLYGTTRGEVVERLICDRLIAIFGSRTQ